MPCVICAPRAIEAEVPSSLAYAARCEKVARQIAQMPLQVAFKRGAKAR